MTIIQSRLLNNRIVGIKGVKVPLRIVLFNTNPSQNQSQETSRRKAKNNISHNGYLHRVFINFGYKTTVNI